MSLAGLRKGLQKGSQTRSGLLWEVERILKELTELKQRPDCLIMENVVQIHSQENLQDFMDWEYSLERMGYKNYCFDLSATEVNVPQTRVRCFMVSLLGEYNYNEPKRVPLKRTLKDLLEHNVSKKYYLSEKMIKGMLATTYESYKLENKLIDKNGCANTIIARYDGSPQVIEDEELIGTYDFCKSDSFRRGGDRFMQDKKTANTLLTNPKEAVVLKIKNATSQGYLEATIGDGVDISSRMESHRGTVQKEKAQTLLTQCQGGVVVNNNNSKFKNGKSLTVRKLTPRECFRLMGVKDEDFDKIKDEFTDGVLYHLAGDSIVVDCLKAILQQMM